MSNLQKEVMERFAHHMAKRDAVIAVMREALQYIEVNCSDQDSVQVAHTALRVERKSWPPKTY
jgi:hypothetical protein